MEASSALGPLVSAVKAKTESCQLKQIETKTNEIVRNCRSRLVMYVPEVGRLDMICLTIPPPLELDSSPFSLSSPSPCSASPLLALARVPLPLAPDMAMPILEAMALSIPAGSPPPSSSSFSPLFSSSVPVATTKNQIGFAVLKLQREIG